jgi:hydrogenase/urease accessory protein HupE
MTGLRPAHDAALGPFDLVLQLFDHQVHGDQRGLADGLGPDGVPVTGHDHLTALTVGDPRVVLLREVDLGTIETGTVLTNVTHLLLGQGSNLVGHDLPAMRDDYVHSYASSASLIDDYCSCWPVLLVGR